MDNATVSPGQQTTKRVDALTDFDLEEIFLERCPLIRIDGDIYCYNWNEKCFSYVDDKLLESLVRDVLREELRKIGSARKIKAVAYLLKTEQLYNGLPGELAGKLGFANGVLDLVTWTLEWHMSLPPKRVKPDIKAPNEHATLGEKYQNYSLNQKIRPLPAITYCLPIDYIDIPIPNFPEVSLSPGMLKEYFATYNVTTPAADQFFYDIADGNQELIRRIYEVIGYIIVPDTKAKAFFLLQGESNSGKSVFGNFLEGFFPHNRITALDISRLGGRYLPEALYTSCLNLSMDLANGILPAKAVANLKMLTGDDLIALEAKYKDAKPYRGLCKFIFSTNHDLKLTERDKAFLNRIVCIPFAHSVPKQKQDPTLLEKLRSERSNIAAKALFYYRLFLNKNRQFSGDFSPKISYQLSLNSTVRAFVEEECELGPVDMYRTYTKDLYVAYTAFCSKNHFINFIDNAAGFAQRLSSMYEGQVRADRWRDATEQENLRGFLGIKLAYHGWSKIEFSI